MLLLRASLVVSSSLFAICMCSIVERKVNFILMFVQNFSPLHEAAEGVDFLPKLDPYHVGVAKLKVV